MIHINIGSNLDSKFGTRFKNISIAINFLIDAGVKIKKISNFYETPSYPNKKLPKFINIGALVESKLNHLLLLKQMKLIEKKIGRIKSKKNDPRVCDLDIIDYAGLSIKTNSIQLPHPKCHLRNFVLYPIKEIDSAWNHPILMKNIDFLINDLSLNSRIEITRLKKSVII
jgi:2-amino-4-hydroxy-6-hydroxymethyldihydropteridine diphosphokinase